MYVKAFIVNVNKCLKLFSLTKYQYYNTVTLQSFWFICSLAIILIGKREADVCLYLCSCCRLPACAISVILVVPWVGLQSFGTDSANSAKFSGFRPRINIGDPY